MTLPVEQTNVWTKTWADHLWAPTFSIFTTYNAVSLRLRSFYFVSFERKPWLASGLTLVGRGMWPGCIYADVQDMTIIELAVIRGTCCTTEHSGDYDSVTACKLLVENGKQYQSCWAGFFWTGLSPWMLLNLTPKHFIFGLNSVRCILILYE